MWLTAGHPAIFEDTEVRSRRKAAAGGAAPQYVRENLPAKFIDLVYNTTQGMANITHATSETSETKLKNRTFRRFVSTIYGKDGTVPIPPEWDSIKQKISYFAYAHEVCPTTQRPHLQCYGYCILPMRMPGICKVLARPENSHARVAEMAATFAQNEQYCSKEGELIQMGVLPAQGTRTDLLDVKKLLDQGKRPMEIADEHEEHFGAVMKFSRSMNEYSDYKRRKLLQNDRTLPEVYIRFGPSGSGKTRWLDDNYGSNWSRVPDNSGHWFDNCDSDVILFDDVKINEIPPIGKILQLTDRYPIQVAKKGGFITWKPRVIVFTSNYPPDQWWNLGPNDKSYDAFLRRVTKIEEVVYKTPEVHGLQTQVQGPSYEEEEVFQEEENDFDEEYCDEDCEICFNARSGTEAYFEHSYQEGDIS